ncbi:tripartite tricarboxylate transporter permease [Clostridium sp. AM58-1XD]|uniref:tripartite tricarboxylate transporter permease n=1 Tax=Clostridium sp. AM58-1XD TaxID=2292307 RepID=UPI000E4A1572|nr:tripartite tricarboxylate transporter permease [Clostridium sp. AM58-1XD]RGY98370.1 Tat pathway signal protein [Clostridium sp. AM58-1XD]
MISSLAAGLGTICTPSGFMIIILCVAAGIIFGSIPGLSATMAIALFLPVSYSMTPIMGMTMLVSIYIGGVSGGLISAILLKMPGTPSSVATCFDGYPMTQKGEAIKALGIGVFFSFAGTLVSIIALIFIAPNLANLALRFGDYEYFSIAVFSLTMIASLSSDSMIKGLLSGVFGIMLATVGLAPIDAAPRFTFGSTQLSAGLDILPVLIGMFALSEIMTTAETSRKTGKAEVLRITTKGTRGFGFSVKEGVGQIPNAVRSALIGLGIGILPGLGGSTSNLIAYTVAKNQSKHPEKFGTGIIDGVVATETSNNASVGGAMIPLLTLGIPGDMATAMLLGGLMIHGLVPGPLLFKQEPVFVYGIFAAMLIANVVMLFEEFFGLRAFVMMLRTPKHILLPIIFVLCIVGAFGLNSRVFDTFIVIAFGIVGYIFIRLKLPVAPLIMGFILGSTVETYFRRALMTSKGSYVPFFTRPISGLFLAIAMISVILTIYKNVKAMKKKRSEAAV